VELFVQRVLDGVASGSIYAALGLSLVLVYRTTATLNLAQGEMAMLSAFLAWWLCADASGPELPLGVAVVVAIAASFVLGGLIERVFMRPVEQSNDHLRAVIVTIALFVMINATTGWLFSSETQRLPSMFPGGNVDVGDVTFPKATIGVLIVLALLCVVLWLLLQRTKIGLAMRAVASNPESAGLSGVPVGSLLLLGWGLAAAVGGLAGILVAPRLYLSTGMMQGVLIYAFAAIAIGGFDSFVGAIVGGFAVGIIESLLGSYVGFIGSQLKLSSALVIRLLILMFRPTGIFGRARVERV
jgi:branched-chain amino acid transport system permease protein